jgi:hypothetical protein
VGWKVTLGEIFSLKHLTQFMELWAALQNVQLQASTEDRITWKPTANGEYTAKLDYEVQFLGSIVSNLHKTMWKAWLPKFNYSLIYLHKIEFRRRTVYKSVGGQTAAFVPFASKRRRRFLTFSSIAATPPVQWRSFRKISRRASLKRTQRIFLRVAFSMVVGYYNLQN